MDWNQLRDEMPVTRQWAYFDHAAVAPLTRRAQLALAEYAADLTDNGAVHVSRWEHRMEEVRALAAKLINADPPDVAFIKNTSEGIGIVAEGFPWQAGDNVVIAEEEYPANVYPWLNLQTRGVEVRRVATRDATLQMEDITAAMDARTRELSLSYVEFTSGFRNDLAALGELCRRRGVLFFVDAIQGLGVLSLDVQTTPIDFLAADGHKFLLSPEGAGIFWIRRELVERLHPVGVGWNSVVNSRNFSTIDFRLKPNAGRWESGSLNVPGIHALGGSLSLLLEVGVAAIEERVLQLTDYLCSEVERAGFNLYSSRKPQDKSAIVSLLTPGGDVRQIVRVGRQQGIVINQRGGRLRVSPHAYNTREEIDRLVKFLSA
jgi:selenocysteine lyase/cysteine desulfurase